MHLPKQSCRLCHPYLHCLPIQPATPYKPISLPKFLMSMFFILVLLLFSSPINAANLSIISHPANLSLPDGDQIESSPVAGPGRVIKYNRIHIHGIPPLQNWDKYAHALKIRVSGFQSDVFPRAQPLGVELCFHRNASVGVGMCRENQWEKLTKSSWVKSLSPFRDIILDVRMTPQPSRYVEVSTELEFLFHRLLFLVLGLILMVMARGLSESMVLYYGSFMTVGVIIVILVVLFQGMKLLPTGRKSSLAIVMYSSVVGLATFLLSLLSGALRTLLTNIGISEDMQNPLGIFLLVCLVLAGAWFGYWAVHKFVLDDGGSVDSEVAYFVEWAILIFSSVMIIQSSLDILMATLALVLAILITAILRVHGKLRFIRRLLRKIWSGSQVIHDQLSAARYSSEYSSPSKSARAELRRRRDKYLEQKHYSSPTQDVNDAVETQPEEDAYYSIIHKTPNRKKFTKEEWDEFTKESTKEALKELVSSPDFNKWAVENAERITLTPVSTNHQRKRSFFRWF